MAPGRSGRRPRRGARDRSQPVGLVTWTDESVTVRRRVADLPACSRCLVEVSPGTALCPKCGAAIRLAVVPRPKPRRVGKSRQRLDALNGEDRVFGPATLVLLVSFWLPWYSVGPISVDGLAVHGWLFIAVLDSIVLVLYVLITAFGVGDLATQGRMSKDQLLTLITGANLVLVILAFLLKPSGFGWSWGAFLALAAALVAFLPFGLPFVRAHRRR
jgi:hypothetical protein